MVVVLVVVLVVIFGRMNVRITPSDVQRMFNISRPAAYKIINKA